MAEKIGEDVAKEVTSFLFRKAKKEINYLHDYDRNVGKLRDQVQRLKEMKGRVQQRITSAKERADVILDGIERWVKDADAEAKKVEEFLEKEAEANKTWLHLRTRRHFSSLATVMTTSVSELLEDGKTHDSGVVSIETPAPGFLLCYERKNLEGLETHKVALEKIMEAMKDETKQIIGIYGAGGVGKTTLAKEVASEAKVRFDHVAFTVVSQTLQADKIQKDLETARKKTEQGEKVLFILDDVWGRLDLEELLIPTLSKHKNCKILLTSRSRDVCTAMEAEAMICINPLQKEEAWLLFKAIVGEAVETDGDLNIHAKVVVHECGGLPLLIQALGRALKGKGNQFWKDSANQLIKAAPRGISEDVRRAFNVLQCSYNCLDADAQSCFLLCCLFPEDSNIPMEKLVEYGVGLGKFKGIDSLEDARRKVRTAITNLKSAFLLLDADEEKIYETGDAKMHDVFRDMGIMILNDQQDKNGGCYLVQAGKGLELWQPNTKDLTNNYYAGISLMCNNISALPCGLECPNLHTLLLQRNYRLSEISDDFFQGMKELRVLDLQFARIETLPLSMKLLTSLCTLDLSNNREFDEIHILGELKNLEILKLRFCKVDEVPDEIGQLINLRHFDVRGCHISYIAPCVISRLCNLEELYIGENDVQWDMQEENGKPSSKAIIEELRELKRLTMLDLFIPNANLIQENLSPENLLKFTIQIGGMGWRPRDASDPENYYSTLILTDDDDDDDDIRSPLLDWTVRLIRAAECLVLVFFANLDSIFQELNNTAGDTLKILELEACHNISCVVDATDGAQWPAFRSLEALRLVLLENLSEICCGELPGKAFSKLQSITIKCCNKLLNVITVGSVWLLQNLQRVEVSYCESLTCVFDNKWHAVREGETKFLSMLTILVLEDLPKLEAVWTCPDQLISLSNLVTLKIIKCGMLRKSLFSTTVAKGLVHLRELVISYVDGLEEVICKNDEQETEVGGEETASTMKIVFPCLETIGLYCLRNLKRFCSGNHRMEYPSLYRVDIIDNYSMESWGYGIHLTPKLTVVMTSGSEPLEVTDRDGCRDLDGIIRENFISRNGAFG